ncbi:sodium-dependent bicarbonate transport family permease [Chthonobacter rhizosphaerae]|uniref:sodium-dependent bicarbonate transport family permease n=1 Tax=Chthonobacter rhizosphaerae TaxID=2735553 RepID=UPI0015EF257B|nr:sodium-dependent bicarbonate transport family permease [Chthonobacter rhizosphaerae]
MSGAELALQNLTSPMVLFFALGAFAALMRSDLTIPEAVAKTLALYLMLSIGFKGGVEVAKSGIDATMLLTIAASIVLSFAIPVIGYALLRATTRLSAVDAAAVSAHYGSISIVTFVAATEVVRGLGLTFEGYLIAIAAVMETPAIVSALLLARRGSKADGVKAESGESLPALLREVAFNGSVVMLVGSFLIGWISGERGMAMIAPFVIDPFRGILCLFLLDMGLVAGRGLRQSGKVLTPPALAFGIYFPLISASLAALFCLMLDLSVGGAALLITLAASASYIAVPAAMRLALPEANPALYLTLSLGVTFPFNLTLGIPLYVWIAGAVAG